MDARKLASLAAVVTAALVSMADHPAPHAEGWHVTGSAEGPTLVLDAATTSTTRRVRVHANAAALREEELGDLHATIEALVTGCIPDAEASALDAPARVRVTVVPDAEEHEPFEGNVPLCSDETFVAWPATSAPLAGCVAGQDCTFTFDVAFERLDAGLAVPVELHWNVLGGVNGPLETAPLGAEVEVEVVEVPT